MINPLHLFSFGIVNGSIEEGFRRVLLSDIIVLSDKVRIIQHPCLFLQYEAAGILWGSQKLIFYECWDTGVSPEEFFDLFRYSPQFCLKLKSCLYLLFWEYFCLWVFLYENVFGTFSVLMNWIIVVFIYLSYWLLIFFDIFHVFFFFFLP